MDTQSFQKTIGFFVNMKIFPDLFMECIRIQLRKGVNFADTA